MSMTQRLHGAFFRRVAIAEQTTSPRYVLYIYGLLNLLKMNNTNFTKASTEENRESIEFKIDENSAKC